MKRRSFLSLVGSTTAATGLFPAIRVQASPKRKVCTTADIPYRVLGRTGEKISVVGFPGLALANYEPEVGKQGMYNALDMGINYFDVAPAYGKDGDAEKKMGECMKGINRDSIFLSCKTKSRDKEGARLELERSLKRLNTDHFDLYQLHHLRYADEVEEAFGEGGCMELLLEAKKKGLIRHIGFSAHTTVGALAAMKKFNFDTVMFPINHVEYHHFGFGKEVMDLAAAQGAAVIAIKPTSNGGWPEDVPKSDRRWWYQTFEEQDDLDLAMRFVLSRKNVVTGIPTSFLDIFEKTVEAGKTYKYITNEEYHKLKQTALAGITVFERENTKTSLNFNSKTRYARQPQWAGCPYA